MVRIQPTAPFGDVVAGVAVVHSAFAVEVVTAVAEGVDGCNACRVKYYRALAVSVVGIFRHFGASLVYGNNVAKQILSVGVQCVVVHKARQSFAVVQECDVFRSA